MPAPEPTRVLLAGDTHGTSDWVTELCRLASEQRCDAILQLGDFGYWPHTERGQQFLDRVESDVATAGLIGLFFIDGNHENHDALAALKPQVPQMVPISKHLHWIPRGHRWQWGETSFGALGGAYSADWRDRTPFESWWPNELLTEEDVDVLGSESLDVLVTHDGPTRAVADLGLRSADSFEARSVRNLIERAVGATSPKLLVHGHWHHRYSFTLPVNESSGKETLRTQVEGLGADIHADERAWAVLDLAPLNFVGTPEPSEPVS